MSATEAPVIYHLEPWDKLVIIAAALTALFTIGILVFCAISPLCCLFHICPCKEKDEREKKGKDKVPAYGSTTGSHATPYYKPEQNSPWQPLQSFKDTDTSDWSDYSSHDVIEMKQDRHQKEHVFKPIRSEPQSPSSPTIFLFQKASLVFGLMYDRVDGRLTMRVQKLSNFSITDPDGAMTPYVKVRLYRAPRSFFTFRGKASREHEMNNLDVEFQTKILRRSTDPAFNEIFMVPIDANEIHHYTLKMLVCDFDRYTRHIVVGEVVVPLSRVEWTTQTEVVFDEPLQPPVDENLGEVQIGLMYLPTAEKLSLTIIKAQGLKIMDQAKASTNAFMKVNLMFDGRPMKKTKTSVRLSDVSPVFNETMTFDVPHYQLDKVYFSIAVIHIDKDAEKPTRALVGRLYLGMNFDSDARAQWNEMIQNSRKQVACWHKLQI
ncbi:synaptotagmin-A-like [Haliotis rufescens]|uniref:synaptotagmin-A-like n=1 Tax=Haliotis rufescens TaxID=6454 RepID=UPI00201F410F|nr:synaptotagmin-A-like [Haliotis rufescens]